MIQPRTMNPSVVYHHRCQICLDTVEELVNMYRINFRLSKTKFQTLNLTFFSKWERGRKISTLSTAEGGESSVLSWVKKSAQIYRS